MAICQGCNQEMLDKVGCSQPTYDDTPFGELARIPYGREPRKFTNSEPWPIADAARFVSKAQGQSVEWSQQSHCSDCGTPFGLLHHPGCAIEDCPACGFQAIACDCLEEEEEEDLLTDVGLPR